MRTISPGRRVMDQPFVDCVAGSVCRLKLPPSGRAPGGVVFGNAPLEYNLNLFPGRKLRRDFRWNGNLTVRREFASEVSGLHFSFLTPSIILRPREETHRERCLTELGEASPPPATTPDPEGTPVAALLRMHLVCRWLRSRGRDRIVTPAVPRFRRRPARPPPRRDAGAWRRIPRSGRRGNPPP